MGIINERIKALEDKINEIYSQMESFGAHVAEKARTPYTVGGGNNRRETIRAVDENSGLNILHGGSVIWNNSEVNIPPADEEPSLPTVGYNKHPHSRYGGGALIKDVTEVVEYDWGIIVNKHSEQFWVTQPKIAKEKNSNDEAVEKIGLIDFIFNPDRLMWGVSAYEIDIKKCYLVERDADGNIAIDSKGNEKKSLLYSDDATKTSIVWDENAQCFRLYAVYSSSGA